MTRLKVRNAVVCDLVRTEDTGKHILIGVYAGAILFDAFPARFAPAFWLEVAPPDQEEINIQFKLDAPVAKKLNVLTATLPLAEPVVGALVVNPTLIEIIKPGRLALSVRLVGQRWTEVLAKDLDLKPSAPPAS
jgi:hypothetical protein